MTDERKNQCRTLVNNLSARFNELGVLRWMKLDPATAEHFWATWDLFDVAMVDKPWDEAQAIARDLYCMIP